MVVGRLVGCINATPCRGRQRADIRESRGPRFWTEEARQESLIDSTIPPRAGPSSTPPTRC